jgi:hypothetical protein
MAAITFDGQSFMLDGRRVWLVSGQICYARVPRAYWGDRIAAARNAGLNCIETPVIWARHEARQGQFDFTADNDLRSFVQLVGQAGMYCILRPGPFVDQGWDLGGLPPWLLNNENVKLRTANQPFLEACSRYITAVAEQVRDLQANSPAPRGQAAANHTPGPIVMIQNESGWTCGDDVLAQTYLGELDRYYREAGFTVPIINANELWQSVEGEIDGWTGFDGLLAHLRQLGAVRPAQPRIVIDFAVGQRRAWNRPANPGFGPGQVMRRIAEVLAAGGQINLSPFCGGTNFGFSAGRDPAFGAAGFLCTSNDAGAPLNEMGMPAPSYGAVRRICTFASRFSRVLSHLDPARQPVGLLPESHGAGKHGAAARVSVIHAVGSQGGVAFVFGDEQGENSKEPMSLVLPDGSTLPVHLNNQSVVWCLLDTRLTGRANLDYTNLCAFALVGKVLVLFGSEGTEAMLSINGAPLEAVVPGGETPLIQQHEGVTVIIASHAQLDSLFVDDTGVYLGIEGLDRRGRPILPLDAKHYTRIDAEGVIGQVKVTPGPLAAKPKRPSLDEWFCCETREHVEGSSPRFAGIAKPADLVALGAPYGYGWYRVKFTSHTPRKAKLLFTHAGHRVHVSLDGESVGLVGVGPGASRVMDVHLKKGPHTLVALAENAGRSSSGADLGEKTGLYGHIWEVEELKPGKPKIVATDPVDILAFKAPLWRLHRDDMTDAHRLSWKIDHRSKNPVAIEIGPFQREQGGDRDDGLLLLNGKPVHYFSQGGTSVVFLDPAVMAKGNNELQIAMVGSTAAAAEAVGKAVRFFDCIDSPTIKGEWAFAKWEPPAATGYHKLGRSASGPAWWRCAFNAGEGDSPLLLDLAGLTKGQIYVNGRHIGRYWVGTADGKKVPPQTRYVIPRSFLAADGADELVIFDEHGHHPGKCKMLSDAEAEPVAG